MTKKRQPPLLDPASTDLPSPLFASRPGWGGQLKAWWHENAYPTTFRIVLLAAIILVAISITKHRTPQTAVIIPTPTPVIDDAYMETAARGEGLNRLAGRALDAYLVDTTSAKLDAIEHIWAIDRLVNIVISMSSVYTPQDIEPGQTVRFPTPAIEYAIREAKALSPAQRAALSKYVK